MSSVEFKWLPEANQGSGELAITVDGEPLPELFRRLEEPFASQPGELAKPGSYSGMFGYALQTSVTEHYEGKEGSHRFSGPPEKTVLLVCHCGEVGCWPLMARVILNPATVVWSDFEQPFRTARSRAAQHRGRAAIWDYGDLSFTFDRKQYMGSLGAAEAAFQAWRRSQTA